jgi:hypothetical protein
MFALWFYITLDISIFLLLLVCTYNQIISLILTTNYYRHTSTSLSMTLEN